MSSSSAPAFAPANRTLPPFVWCSYGFESLVFETWSVRSLARFSWPRMHLVVAERNEAEILKRRLSSWIDPELTTLTTEVVEYPLRGTWGGFFYKPYALAHSEFCRENPYLVYCDSDVLIKQDPRPVLATTDGALWSHKLDHNKVPADQSEVARLEGKRPGTSQYAIAALIKRFGPVEPLRWVINAGFFQLPGDRSREIIDTWNRYVFSLDRSVFFSDQEVLTVVLHHLGLEPICDKRVNYPMATHYLSGLKPQMIRDAVDAGLDRDRLRYRLLLRAAPRAARRWLSQAARIVRT